MDIGDAVPMLSPRPTRSEVPVEGAREAVGTAVGGGCATFRGVVAVTGNAWVPQGSCLREETARISPRLLLWWYDARG